MIEYQNFSPKEADLYDNTTRLYRRCLFVLGCILRKEYLEVFNNTRFLEIEIYLRTQSTNRLMNRAKYLWNQDDV
jgi:hypothetical protein